MPLNHTSQFAELTDDHFKAIGKIVVEWANIESLLAVLLSRLLFTPEFIARSYTDNMSAVKLQESIKEGIEIHRQRYSCKLISESMLLEITQTIEKLTAIRVTRNKFAHFCWARSSDNEIFGTNFSGGLPSSKKHNKSHISYTLKELDKFYKESYEMVDNLSVLVEALPELSEESLIRHFT